MGARICRVFWIPFVVVLTGCVPRLMEIPDYLADTPVEQDIRREIIRSRRPVRIVTSESRPRETFQPILVFPAAVTGMEERSNRADRIGLVPASDRMTAINDALEWLLEHAPERTLLAYSTAGLRVKPDDLPAVATGAVRSLRLDRAGETEVAAQRILGTIGGRQGDFSVLLMAGEHNAGIAGQLFRLVESGSPRVVAELLLPHSGVRLRDAGIPIAGALVLDLAGTLRELPIRLDGADDIYVPVVFYRY